MKLHEKFYKTIATLFEQIVVLQDMLNKKHKVK